MRATTEIKKAMGQSFKDAANEAGGVLKRQGMRTRDIAENLGIGETTVRSYLKREREELNLNGNRI